MERTRRDRCPGVLRPWPAEDGLLVRLRLIGGRIPSRALRAVADVARVHGDGRVHVTVRANLQLRGLPAGPVEGELPLPVLAAIKETGLVPSPGHDLVRNVLVSPRTGLPGAPGRSDLRHVASGLDRLLLSSDLLAGLPGRFLFVLDDGTGDVLGRDCDVGLVALGGGMAQIRAGTWWGPVTALAAVPYRLAALASAFLTLRGEGPTAPWHGSELAEPLFPPETPDPRLPEESEPLPFGDGPCGRHAEVPAEGLSADDIAGLTDGVDEVIVTPWKGVLVPGAGPG